MNDVENVTFLFNKKFVVAQMAPAVRVTVGEIFGKECGINMTEELTGLLKLLGFNEVIETPFGADIVTYIEALEFLEKLKRNDGFPLFNSCCVGWREYAERRHPELKSHVSRAVSPMMAAGAITKMHFSKLWNLKPEDIAVVGIMPCTLKKHETQFIMPNGMKYVDYVITTKELKEWVNKEGIELKDIKPTQPNKLTLPSMNGVIFGTTGGITEAMLTTLSSLLGEKKTMSLVRENNTLREYEVNIGEYNLHVGVVYGFASLEKLLKRIKEGEIFHFIEVMMCPLGCVGGPGQLPASIDCIKKRAEGLRETADKMRSKNPVESPSIKNVEDFIKSHLNLFMFSD